MSISVPRAGTSRACHRAGLVWTYIGRLELHGFSAILNLISGVDSRPAAINFLGLKIETNQTGFLGGFLDLSDAESMNFHCVPNRCSSRLSYSSTAC